MENAEKLVNLLIEKKLHITTAESCTGGMVASRIVDVANASKVFNVAYVTYANEAKEKYLNVDSKTIEKYGVVSEEVTKQMAFGALKEANADISIVTSGIAGPTGGTEYKPVGMVCFGVGIKDNVYTSTKYFGNIGRNKVRSMATEYIIDFAINLIEKM
jgi:putative competence-damage inducible protein